MTEAIENKINVHKWLKDNKLGHLLELFESKSIEIEELAEIDVVELKKFASETLKLDILSKKRFIAAITKIKPDNETSQTVMVTVEENDALTKLYERFDECSKQRLLIQQALNKSENNLDWHYTKCINDINILFNEIKQLFISRKDELLQHIDDITNNKQTSLTAQLNTLQNHYIPLINKGISKYEAYVNNNNRKLNILPIVNDIISFDKKFITTTHLIIPPQLKFNINNTMKLGMQFMNTLHIDDGDKPLPPKVNILKVDSTFIYIQYDIKNKYYKSINKPISKICIEYALIKDDEKLWKDDWKFTDNNAEIGPGFFTMGNKENSIETHDLNKNTAELSTQEINENDKNTLKNTFQTSNNETHSSWQMSGNDTSDTVWSTSDKDKKQNETNFSWSFGSENNNAKTNLSWSFDKSDNNNTFGNNNINSHSTVKRAVLNKFESCGARNNNQWSTSIENNFSKLFTFEQFDNKSEIVKEPETKLINICLINSYNKLKWFKEEIKISKKRKLKYQKEVKQYKIIDIKDNKTYVIRIKLLNESGWSNYSKQLYIIKTPKSIIQSKILTIEEQIKLKQSTDLQTGFQYKKWKLLYRASKHGFDSDAFFKKCHSKKNTLCVINVKGTNNVFGGFTSLAWDKTMHSSNIKQGKLYDGKSFVYSLRNKDKKTSEINVYNSNCNKWSSWGNSNSPSISYGWNKFLMFGENGNGFYCIDNCNKNKDSSASSQKCNAYSNLLINTLNGTKTHFYVKDIEVFQLVSNDKGGKKTNKSSSFSNKSKSNWSWNSNLNQNINNDYFSK